MRIPEDGLADISIFNDLTVSPISGKVRQLWMQSHRSGFPIGLLIFLISW